MIFLGILISLLMIFIFWASGSAIIYFTKIKVNNTFISVGIGFFSYFAFISLLLFPLEVLSILSYDNLIYATLSLTVLYIILTFIFSKFWFSSKLFSIDIVYFIIIFFIFFILDFKESSFIDSKNQNVFKNTISTLYWIRDIQSSLFGDLLSGELALKNIQSWYTFQLALTKIVNFFYNFELNKNQLFNTTFFYFNTIIDSALSASVCLLFAWYIKKNKNFFSDMFFLMLSTICFVGFRILLFYNEVDIWSSNLYFVYLLLFVMKLFFNYVSKFKKTKNQTILIGVLISSYIAFSWDLSYQLLFLIYSMFFILQMWLKNIFIKDIYKIGVLFFIDFIFYNIIEKLYLLSVIYTFILLLISLTLYLMNKNYNVVVNFEIKLANNQLFWIMITPVFLIVSSIFISLAKDSDILSLSNTGNIVFYDWYTIFGPKLKLLISSIFSFGVLVAAFLWILFQQMSKNSSRKLPIDLLCINYVTFFNPLSVKVLRFFIYDNIQFSSGIILIVAFLMFTIELLDWLNEYIFSKFKFVRLKKFKAINGIRIKMY